MLATLYNFAPLYKLHLYGKYNGFALNLSVDKIENSIYFHSIFFFLRVFYIQPSFIAFTRFSLSKTTFTLQTHMKKSCKTYRFRYACYTVFISNKQTKRRLAITLPNTCKYFLHKVCEDSTSGSKSAIEMHGSQ